MRLKLIGGWLAGAVALLAELALPRHGWGVPVLVVGLLGAWLTLSGVRRHRPASALPWYLLAVGVAAPAAGFALQQAAGRGALDFPGVTHGLVVIGMIASNIAYGLFVRAKTRVLDRYQVVDLAIMVVSAGLAFSQLVLDPAMDANPPVGISRGLSTVYILSTVVSLVLVTRFASLPGRRGPSVWILTSSTGAVVIGSVLCNSTATFDNGGFRVIWNVAISAGLIQLAARHESMRDLTEAATGEAPRFGALRLAGLGVALFLNPLTAVLLYNRTGELSVPMVLIPAAVVTVLVMARLRLLFGHEQAAREEVAAGREAFRALIHGISDVITVLDRRGAVVYASDSAAKVLGRPAAELTGQTLPDLVHPDDAEELRELIAQLTSSGRTASSTVRMSVDGADRVFELEAADRTDDVNVRGVIVVLHEVTDRHQLERELRHQALHDTLTELPNRKLLMERVQSGLATGKLISVLFIDLDDFKHVNDGMGHHAGDLLLSAVAGRLQHAAREGDTVARLGGDEFAILVVDDQQGAAQAVARRMLEVLERPFEVLGQRLSVGASVGLASAVGGSVEDLLRNADVAMYGAKAAGKGTFAIFEPGMQEVATARLSLHTDLADGIARGELRVLYQPIMDLDTGRLRSGEALVRWAHPTLGLLSPDRFIELAEDTGLIVPLGRAVLAEACREAATWPEDIGIAVNLSARQLEDEAFLADVAEALRESGITPSRLILEVTESLVMRNVAATAERLAACRALGVRVAIDDFGTGYSSLSSLMELPVDILKIDRSFVASMLDHQEGTALVDVLVEMGRTLGLDVVAEGIEETEQLTKLRVSKCHQGQGFLYSRPVSAEEFQSFLREHVALSSR